MKGFLCRYLLVLAGTLLFAFSGSAWAQAAAAGRFLSVTGDVKVVDAGGKPRTAQRGGDFRQGETIVTGPNALAQLRTGDGGLLSVRADTEMKLDKFAYAGENDSNASFLVSLVKGGFRTITGLIGRANRDGYRVTTPSATIGIRGTHYELVHVLPQAASQQAPAGTYNRVFDGITTIQNKAGILLLVNREQTGFVSLPGNVAPVLVAPPAQIFGRPTPVPRLVPQGSSGGDKGQTATGGSSSAPATGATASQPATLTRPTATLTPITTTISPIESTTTIKSGTTSTLISPITTTTTISPTTSTLSTTTLSPTTSTLSTTTLSPTTSTLSTTTLSPTTSTLSTTISPITSTISPTTTTISTTPITTTAPTTTTTTISPTTTTLSPTTTTIKLAPTTTLIK
jgi:FecR protein